jgi:hypothetical protein
MEDYEHHEHEKHRRHRKHHHRADGIVFTFHKHHETKKGERMQGDVGQTVSVVGNATGKGLPSKAVLSNQVFTSSDAAVFTVAPDPAVPGGAIITFVGAGTATLTESATATEPDGVTTGQVQGTVTIVTSGGSVNPSVADGIAFTFGVVVGPGQVGSVQVGLRPAGVFGTLPR